MIRAAYTLGGFVASGDIANHDALAALREAGSRHIGIENWDMGEAEQTISDGPNAGRHHPLRLIDEPWTHSRERTDKMSVNATTDARITEAEFRAKVPQQLDGIEILEVTRFDCGTFHRGTYALAAALTRAGSAFSTHTVIYQDERNSFLLSTGHYDIPTRAEAEDDARSRAVGLNRKPRRRSTMHWYVCDMDEGAPT